MQPFADRLGRNTKTLGYLDLSEAFFSQCNYLASLSDQLAVALCEVMPFWGIPLCPSLSFRHSFMPEKIKYFNASTNNITKSPIM